MANKIGYLNEYGLGDALVSLHYINWLFNANSEAEKVIFQTSFRNEFVSDLFKLCSSHLPTHHIITDGNGKFNSREYILSKYRDFKISYLNYTRDISTYKKDLEILSRNRFNFKKLVPTISKFKDIIKPPCAVFSVDVLGADRLISGQYWKRKEIEWLSKGITPVLVGKEPVNQIDLGKRKSNSIRCDYVPGNGVIDLREKTTIEDVFYLIGNSFVCEFPANGLSVIAYELGVSCKVFGTENTMAYDHRFFPKRYPGFDLVVAAKFRE